MNLQATALDRVLACNGSLSMGDDHLPMEEADDDKRDGIAAHHVATAVLSGMISDPLEYVDRKTPNGVFVTADMADFVEKFTATVTGRDGMHESVISGCEIATDFDVTEDHRVLGRTDHYSFHPLLDTLYIDQLHYGWGIVEPENNWALISYALGITLQYGWRPAKTVLTVFQPRPYHRDGYVRSTEMTTEELAHKFNELRTSLLGLSPIITTGDHCRHCPALPVCPAARKAGMNGIDAIDTVFIETLSPAALSFEIENLDRAFEAIKHRRDAIRELATHRRKQGEIIPSYDLEPTYGHRKWHPSVTVETAPILTGVNLTVTKLASPAEAKRLKVPEAVIALLSDIPSTGYRLVRTDLNKQAKKLLNRAKE